VKSTKARQANITQCEVGQFRCDIRAVQVEIIESGMKFQHQTGAIFLVNKAKLSVGRILQANN
jgi:hypothetical protein